MKIALKYIRFSIFSFYPFEFFVSSASTCQCSSLARPSTHHINLAVMAAPPDAESLESRISEYFKLILPSQCCLKTRTLTNYYPRVVVGEMTAHHSSACPGRGD